MMGVKLRPLPHKTAAPLSSRLLSYLTSSSLMSLDNVASHYGVGIYQTLSVSPLPGMSMISKEQRIQCRACLTEHLRCLQILSLREKVTP